MTRWVWAVCVGLVVGICGRTSLVMAATDASSTPPPKASGATFSAAGGVTVEPNAVQIRHAIEKYVQETTEEEGVFYVDDEVTGETRELTLNHIHDQVGKTGDYYYACADMKDDKTGEALDVDFDVDLLDGQLEVIDVSIHKVNGQERYTYDAHNTRVPVGGSATTTP